MDFWLLPNLKNSKIKVKIRHVSPIVRQSIKPLIEKDVQFKSQRIVQLPPQAPKVQSTEFLTGDSSG